MLVTSSCNLKKVVVAVVVVVIYVVVVCFSFLFSFCFLSVASYCQSFALVLDGIDLRAEVVRTVNLYNERPTIKSID